MAGPTSPLTFRIPDDLRRELELEATEDGSVSERLLWHLRRSINRKREEQRDPALQALLLLITRLAEDITGGELMPDRALRSRVRGEWRSDLFQFRAFKFAVKKLLDTLGEPSHPAPRAAEEEVRSAAAQYGGSPELIKLVIDLQKSPEAMGGWVFGNIWTRFTNSHLPFTEKEQRMIREQPVLGRVMEREYYDFQKARKALELEAGPERMQKTLERLGKTGKLSPDIEAALKAISEAAGVPPTLEGVSKLVRSKKPKDKAND